MIENQDMVNYKQCFVDNLCSSARSLEWCPWKNLNAAMIRTVGLMSHNRHNSEGNLLHPFTTSKSLAALTHFLMTTHMYENRDGWLTTARKWPKQNNGKTKQRHSGAVTICMQNFYELKIPAHLIALFCILSILEVCSYCCLCLLFHCQFNAAPIITKHDQCMISCWYTACWVKDNHWVHIYEQYIYIQQIAIAALAQTQHWSHVLQSIMVGSMWSSVV